MSTVAVTGAACGIGAETCLQLLDAGYTVVGCDLIPETGLSPELAGLAGRGAFTYLQHDVTSESSAVALADYLRERGDYLYGLVNCAGFALAKPLLETSLEEWEKAQAINSTGVFLTTRELARLMVEQGDDPQNRRCIITVASNAALVPRAEFGAYGASKAAALRLTSSFGLQLAAHGIRANTVCPGTTLTPMVTELWGGQDLSNGAIAGSTASFRLGIPLGRVAEPADVAANIVFLLSPAARHTTLQTLTVDGGATL